ncbi:MAG: DUF192 domain-containing protein [Thermoflexaceae bacterium]|nr:DUF192 domain-containing protein [Thermoflexaceae bacterium]
MRPSRDRAATAFAACVAALLVLSCGDGAHDAPVATTPTTAALPTAELLVSAPGGASARLTVEIAATPAARERGLMFRESLPEDRGMLFVFAASQHGGFWMKDTRIPLTIAYLDGDGRVLELHEGVPLATKALIPGQPYRYALEVNHGWFERHNLGVGAVVQIPPGLPAPE